MSPNLWGNVLANYIETAHHRPRDIALALTRTRSRTGREVLAPLALPSHGAASLEALAAAYLNGSLIGGERTAFGRALQVPEALEYAYVTAAQDLAPSDRMTARGLLTAIVDIHGESALNRSHAELLLQLALDARDFTTVEHILATLPLRGAVRQLAATDASNPWIRPGTDEASWLALLNANLYRQTLLPVTLLPEGETPFDRLTAKEHRPVRHDRRITVIMSSYDPGRHLITAVRSVVQQTWQNFELLIVDDASVAPMPGVYDVVEEMDSRVRVIRKAFNGGTYRARNTALAQATGDFFTCVDSDDWIHPQRLELGVRPLLEDPGLIATRGFGVRATSDLEFSRIGRGGRIVASSSLMVRTIPGLSRLGFFDPVRRGADNEYARRLEAAFGGAIVNLPRDALTILLADDASLSASDFSPGWRHPARSEYADSHRRFHEEIENGRRIAFLDPCAPRPFPAPSRWERYPQDGESPHTLDLCVIADWRSGCLQEATVDYVTAAAAQGAVVGVVHVESLHEMRPTTDPVAPSVRELIHDRVVERVYLDDHREASRVVVADPRPFQFPGEVTVGLRTTRLHANSMPGLEHARQFDTATTGQHLTSLFGTTPVWDSALPPLRLPD